MTAHDDGFDADLHTTPAMAILERARAAAADFDREMAKVRAVIDGGGGNLAALRQAAASSRHCGQASGCDEANRGGGCPCGERVREEQRKAGQ